MIIIGGTSFLIFMVIILGGFAVKEGLKGGCGGCGVIVAIIIILFVIWFLFKSCNEYQEQWGEVRQYEPKHYNLTFDGNKQACNINVTPSKFYPSRNLFAIFCV